MLIWDIKLANKNNRPEKLKGKPQQTNPERSLEIRLATHDFCCTDCVHLGSPAWRRYNLAYGAHFVGSIAWDTDVVVALEDDLDVADVELW